jgi:ribosomal protein L3 glutamine methyltransferase
MRDSPLIDAVVRRPVKFEESKAATHSLRDAIRHCYSHMQRSKVALGQGTLDAYDEAVSLVLWTVHLPPDTLDPFLDTALTHTEKEVIFELLRRRCQQREPLAYLTGEAWLAGFRFKADPRALIPRSPIAQVLLEGLDDFWLAESAPHTILDMCTGGGSLAIIAAHCFEDADLLAIDVSEQALALAQENVAAYDLQGRIRLQVSNGLAALADQPFDLVICNPPYVNASSMEGLPKEFNHEPELALSAGPAGMQFIEPFVHQLGRFICAQGGLLLEVGHEADAFEALFAERIEFSYIPVPAGERTLVWVQGTELHRLLPTS